MLALWRPVPSRTYTNRLTGAKVAHSGNPDAFEAVCGRRGCVTQLVICHGGEPTTPYGFVFDANARLYRMSSRTRKQFERAKARGETWGMFRPKPRHNYIASRPHRQPPKADYPYDVECPVCGLRNTITGSAPQ